MGTDERYGRWLDLIGDLMRRPLDELPVETIANALREDLGATLSGWIVRDANGDVVPRIWPTPPPELIQTTDDWAHNRRRQQNHPLVFWTECTGDLRAISIDRLPVALLGRHRLAAWREESEPLGIPHQMHITLALRGRAFRTFAVSRGHEDFSARDVDLARRIQPALVGLERQALALARARNDGREQSLAESMADAGLTARELAVLCLLPGGWTAAAMARRLDISPRTVHKHLEHLYRKLGTRDRLATVLRAQQMGLLPPRPRPPSN